MQTCSADPEMATIDNVPAVPQPEGVYLDILSLLLARGSLFFAHGSFVFVLGAGWLAG
jgi:hypothetical protein